MESTNDLQEPKPKIRKTMDDSSPSSSGAAARSSSSSPSSSGMRLSKSTCIICFNGIGEKEGKATFTADCSHSFHLKCINSNMRHGNRVCPLCRKQLKQVPLCDDNTVPTSSGQRVFEDDESLPQGETQVQSGYGHSGAAHRRQALEINLFPQVSAAAKPVARRDFAALVQLKAEGVTDGMRTGAPLDLIIVFDVSGSMEGMKLELTKKAMDFVIERLGETDRLSVISFSSTARRLFPLTLMSKAGKQVAMEAVKSLVAGGGTNIAEGLKIGARVIEDRRCKNPVSCMMLLSDGQDNFTLAYGGVRLRTDYESLLPSFCRIPVHTFGLGPEHDPELMYTISQVSCGTYSFIETETLIRDAFSRCIEGLLSVVILEQVVEIQCIHEQGLKISSIKAGSYSSCIASDARSATIHVGDMYAEEERDFLVILEIPSCENGSAEPESMSLLKVRCDYKDPVTNEIVRVESGELSIQRPMVLTGEEIVSMEVEGQLNRFLVSQAMSDALVLADVGKVSDAVTLLSRCTRELSKTASARSSDSLHKSLTSELGALQQRIIRWGMYDKAGRPFLFSCLSSHSTQRATARGKSTHCYSLRGNSSRGETPISAGVEAKTPSMASKVWIVL